MSYFSKFYLSIAIFLTAFTTRVVCLLFFRYYLPLQWMLEEHDKRALLLIKGQEIFYANAWSTFYVLLGGFYTLFDWIGLLAYRQLGMIIIQTLTGSFVCVLVFLIAYRLFGKLTAIVTAILFAIYYPFIYINYLVISETFSTLCVVLSFYLLLSKKHAWNYLSIGALLGVAVAIRPMLLTFIPILFIWLIFWLKKDGYLIGLIYSGIAYVCVIAIFSLINYHFSHDHQFKVSGSGGANIAMANCELKKLNYTTGSEYFYFKPPAFHNQNGREVSTQVPFANDGYYLKMAMDCIRHNPSQLITNFSHLYRVFNSTFYPNFTNHPWHLALFQGWKWISLVLLVAFLSFFTMKKFRHWEIRMMYWLSLGYLGSLCLAVYLANPGEERYLVPYFFALILFGVPILMNVGSFFYKTIFKFGKIFPTWV